MIKKIMFLILAFILTVTSVYADVIGHIYKTDIKAYENYMQIPSYNCGGTTVVFVRDLENYGYDVYWDDASRKVIIEKNSAMPWSPIAPVYEGDGAVGTVLYDIYKTDIRTFYGNKEITSYNIGGQTAIKLRDLDAQKNLKFDSSTKKASFFSENISLSSSEKNHIDFMYEILECMSKLDYALEKADKSVKNGKCDKNAMVRVDSAYSSFILLRKKFQDYQEPEAFSKSTMEIWWAVINLQLAADLLKTSHSDYSNSKREKFNAYMLDSYQQRNNGLMYLASEF